MKEIGRCWLEWHQAEQDPLSPQDWGMSSQCPPPLQQLELLELDMIIIITDSVE